MFCSRTPSVVSIRSVRGCAAFGYLMFGSAGSRPERGLDDRLLRIESGTGVRSLRAPSRGREGQHRQKSRQTSELSFSMSKCRRTWFLRRWVYATPPALGGRSTLVDSSSVTLNQTLDDNL